ncbi:MAG: single-stranded DNA-binding protein [Patescibacteria group bacterium]
MYLNKAFIFGNLTRDPDLRRIPSGTSVASFGVATNRVWKDKSGVKKEDAQFHNVVLFGKQADLAAQYLRKGSSVFIEGRMQTRSWEAEGVKKYRTEIVADTMQFGPRTGGATTGAGVAQGQGGEFSGNPGPSPSDDGGDKIDYPDEVVNPEDIPF